MTATSPSRLEGEPVYLDAFASTPLAPEALLAMTTQLRAPGNPHSPHAAGAHAAEAVNRGRAAIAALLGSAPHEVFLTSGATEANNIAVLGWARAALRDGSPRRSIVTSSIEHPSVFEAARAMEREGFRHVVAPVDDAGRLDLDALGRLIDQDTLLVCVMAANNVTGVLQPVREAAALAHEAGALFHADAAQAAGKVPLDVFDLDVDSLSLSGHKMYGPPGVGALYVSASAPARPAPLAFGGGQEQGLRPGTVPAALVAGLGAAARLAAERLTADAVQARGLVSRFLAGLEQRQVRFRTNGSAEHRLPGSLNISISGVIADDLVERLASQVALSTGSACSSGQIDVATTLKAMRLKDAEARSALRIYFHRYSTEADADQVSALLAAAARSSGLATGDFVQ